MTPLLQKSAPPPEPTSADIERAIALLQSRGLAGAVSAASVLGRANEKADPTKAYDQKDHLVRTLRAAAELTDRMDSADRLVFAVIDTARSLDKYDFRSFINNCFGDYPTHSPLLSRSCNHVVAEALLVDAVTSAVNDRALYTVEGMLSAVARFNCSTALTGNLWSKAAFLPEVLQSGVVRERLHHEHGEGVSAIRGLSGSSSVGEFLTQLMKRTRAVERWVGADVKDRVFSVVGEKLNQDELRRYRCATSGRAGEEELLNAVMNREAWVTPADGVRWGVYSDIGNTLFISDWKTSKENPYLERIERLKALEAKSVPVYLCTGGDPGTYRRMFGEIGWYPTIMSKDQCHRHRVHILLDDSTPESQSAAPDPDIYINAELPPRATQT